MKNNAAKTHPKQSQKKAAFFLSSLKKQRMDIKLPQLRGFN